MPDCSFTAQGFRLCCDCFFTKCRRIIKKYFLVCWEKILLYYLFFLFNYLIFYKLSIFYTSLIERSAKSIPVGRRKDIIKNHIDLLLYILLEEILQKKRRYGISGSFVSFALRYPFTGKRRDSSRESNQSIVKNSPPH